MIPLPVLGATVFQQPVVKSPLPGGVASVVRFLFNSVPQWVQILGVFVGFAVAVWVLLTLWRRRAALSLWFGTRRRALQIALGSVVALGVLGFAAFGATSWNYMQHDNAFCTGCHVMGPAYQRFTTSEHDSLSCHDCHQQSIFASARQMYLWVAERPEKIGAHTKLPNQVCERCHVIGEGKKKWERIASTAGHRTHLESDSSALKDVKCVTCHAMEVHRFAPVDSTCGQANCHVKVEIKLAKMRDQTDLHCITCHQFTADVPKLATRDSASGTLKPGMKQCFSCHEMKNVLASFDPAKDPHQGTCGMCHNPHTQASAAEAAKTCTSAKCHVNWRAEPFHLGANHRAVVNSCTLCHLPHTAKVDASDCAGCHRALQGRREHGRTLRPPLPFDTSRALRRTSSRSSLNQVRDPDSSGSSGSFEVRRVRSMLGARESRSNTLETDAPDEPEKPEKRLGGLVRSSLTQVRDPESSGSSGSFEISRVRSMSAGGLGPGGPFFFVSLLGRSEVAEFDGIRPAPTFAGVHVAADSFSHARHKRLDCISCHTSTSQVSGLTFKRPRGCQICHHQAPQTSNCATCHRPAEIAPALAVTPIVTVAGLAPRGRSASFEHTRHRAIACVNCHTTPVSLASSPTARGCQTCHHQAAQTSNCATCHQPSAIASPVAATLSVTVAGHAPRQRPATFAHATHSTIKCVDCHTTPVSLAPSANVATCASCHDEHHGAAKQCSACHAVASGDTASRAAHAPPVDAHAGCDACHSPAIVARLVPDRAMCVTCHVPQQKHYADRECTVCHFQATPDAFRGRLTRRAGGGGGQ